MTETSGRVRHAVYATLAAEGRAPSVGELADRLALPAAEVGEHLRRLHRAHALVLTPAGDAVRMAHPFSTAPMGFLVRAEGAAATGYSGDRMWWGGCAWDSMGIAAALGEPVTMDTRCPGCGAAMRVTVGPDRPPPNELAVRVPWPARRWWDDVVATCTNLRLFCHPEHADTGAARTGRALGQVISAGAMWRLSGPWYGDRLSPDWTPRPRDHAQRLLTEAGLTGEFWELP